MGRRGGAGVSSVNAGQATVRAPSAVGPAGSDFSANGSRSQARGEQPSAPSLNTARSPRRAGSASWIVCSAAELRPRAPGRLPTYRLSRPTDSHCSPSGSHAGPGAFGEAQCRALRSTMRTEIKRFSEDPALFGLDLEAHSGAGNRSQLPVPATFVVGGATRT